MTDEQILAMAAEIANPFYIDVLIQQSGLTAAELLGLDLNLS